jgi:hypothetical protein
MILVLYVAFCILFYTNIYTNQLHTALYYEYACILGGFAFAYLSPTFLPNLHYIFCEAIKMTNVSTSIKPIVSLLVVAALVATRFSKSSNVSNSE